MSWTEQEWSAFAVLVNDWWRPDLTEGQVQSWRVALDGVDPAVAKDALSRMLHKGLVFRPTVSEFVAELRSDPSRPTFEEAWTLMFEKGGAWSGNGNDYTAITEKAWALNPLVGSFVERQGVERLAMTEFFDPEYGPIRRRELHDAWDRHLSATEGREIAALASGRTEGLGRLDPLSALGLTPPKGLPSGEGAGGV